MEQATAVAVKEASPILQYVMIGGGVVMAGLFFWLNEKKQRVYGPRRRRSKKTIHLSG